MTTRMRPPVEESGGPPPFISLFLFAGGGLVLAATVSVLSDLLGNFLPEWASHATSHSSMAIVMASLAVPTWMRRIKNRPIGLQRTGYLVAMWGLILAAFAQVIEALSARLEFPESGWMHDSSGMLTGGALGLFAVGLLMQIRGRRWIPVWLMIPLALIALVFFASMVFGWPP